MSLDTPVSWTWNILGLGILVLFAAGVAFGSSQDDTKKRPASTPSHSSPRQARQIRPPPTTPKPESADPEPETIDVLAGLNNGKLAVEAEGRSDGRITLTIKNRTRKKLRVVLPPGLIASGVSGQFGSMGGFGGTGGMSMGGMSVNGMGGMGMGGMGMGGMGGGMGGLSGTMPPTMGLMMLGRLVMQLAGDHDSWDQRGLTMGGMIEGMCICYMGDIGGKSGGFRSVPPTGLPEAVVKPGETRRLSTKVVSLDPPVDGERLNVPATGETLRVGDVQDSRTDDRVAEALRRLAVEKAPETVAQLVLWRLLTDSDWDKLTQGAAPWANAHEITLARQFIAKLDQPAPRSALEADPGTFCWTASSDPDASKAVLDGLKGVLEGRRVLGLQSSNEVPARPAGPGLACEVHLTGSGPGAKLDVRFAVTDAGCTRWLPSGRFSVPVQKDARTLDSARLADALAAELLDRVVLARLSPGPRVKGKPTYTITIRNTSPLVLNGLALAGRSSDVDSPQMSILWGMCLPPHRDLKLPASTQVVERLRLKKGIRVVGADLSGL